MPASIAFDALKDYRRLKQADATATAAANTAVTATLAAPGASNKNAVLKVDASFDDSTGSSLLEVKSGATVIAQKVIHGAGAIDFDPDIGRAANAQNEAMSATLAAAGAGIIGYVVIQGYSFYEG